MSCQIPALVLAAGASSRCPEGKLTKIYRGRPLLEWTLQRLSDHTMVSPILVVCGHNKELIERLASSFQKATTVMNSQWSQGLATSLKAGIAALDPKDGFLVVLGDTPFFSAATLSKVLPEGHESSNIRMPTYRGVAGHPKYFPAWVKSDFQALQGDQGAKSIVQRHRDRVTKLELEDPGILRDFDFSADFNEE